jgi:8-oxo-dGTP pyrophosphatase MutT (NUDIX family)
MTEPATEAVDRLCARVLLVDEQARVLLFHGCDPADADAGSWWFTPGGGREEGESAQECAARELLEETGLELRPEDMGVVVHERVTEFSFLGSRWRSIEDYFLVRVDSHEVDTSRFSEVEIASVLGHRWWSTAELASTPDTYYPRELLGLLP